MKRHLLTKLVQWKTKNNRKPLIIKGVRQCGKTYLLEQFGKQHFPNYHIINFEKQPKLHNLFNSDLEPSRIVNELRLLLEKPIDTKQDLLIFDEIQACPKALTSLKYFCEDLPELALCSAGSLLGLQLSEGSYPVGKVDMLDLHPLSFSEFLAGIGDLQSAEYLQQMTLSSTISELAHDHFWQRLKQYFVTGGLPEVVVTFAEQQDNLFEASQAVRAQQELLIKAYYADIAKHAGKINAMHIDRTWHAVPIQLSQTNDASVNRFRFKDILPKLNRYSQLANVIDWLSAAELVIKIPLINTVQEPLAAFAKENMFKLMMFDIGLLGAMSGLAPKNLLNYDYGTYKGYFAENFVAQQLKTKGHQHILSWQEGRSEVEFLLSHQGHTYPLEVKSGQITHAKSLEKYRNKYQPEKSIILSANNMSFDHSNKLLRLPLYLCELLPF